MLRSTSWSPSRALVVAVTLLLVVGAPLAAASSHPAGNDQGGDGADGSMGEDKANQTRGPPDAAREHRERGQAMAQQWQDMSSQMRAQAQERAENARLFSLFDYTDGQLSGRFVSAGVDNATGEITDYTVTSADAEATYFTSVALSAFESWDEPLTAGAVFQLAGNNTTVAVHNNPTAQLRYTAGAPVAVTFTLAEDLTRNPAGPALRFDHASGLHFHMLLAGDGGDLEVSSDNTTVTASLDTNATLLVLTHPVQPSTGSANLHERVEAAESGQLGAELSVVGVDGTPAFERTELGVTATPTEAGQGRVGLEVASNASQGRSVVVNVDAETLNGSSAEEIEVTIDGEAVQGLTNAADVLASTGTSATFAVSEVEGALKVTVYVPGFSVHTVLIQQHLDQDSTDDGTTDGGDGTSDDGTSDGGDGSTEDGTTDRQTETPGFGLVASLVATVLAGLALRRRP